jgi:hypothetical protein
MRRAFAYGVVTICLSGLVAGCANQNISDPKTIGLDQALVETVKALKAAQDEAAKDRTNFGFYGCSVTAIFNVSATGGQDNKLVVNASSPPATTIVPINLGVTGTAESTASGTRSNTVTVVLDTKLCASNTKAAASLAGPSRVLDAFTPGLPRTRGKPFKVIH